MKAASTTKSISVGSPEQHLLMALAADPNVAPALAALTTATERFNAIRDRLNDETVEASAVKREADARTALVRAQALFEIGSAIADDVAAARQEHQAAREALQGIAGRDEVLADELRKEQEELAERHDALTDAMERWRSAAIAAARETAQEGIRLIQLAANAFSDLRTGAGFVPRHAGDVGDWLVVNSIAANEDQRSLPMADTSRSAIHLLARAGSLRTEEVQVPRRTAPAHLPPEVVAGGADRVEPEFNTFGRPLLEKLTDEERETLASQPEVVPAGVSVFRSPGMPASLTHDPLGNPLPEAKALLDRRKAGRRAPYDDGRGGAVEVAR
ncbi:MAG: hypothetical protein WBA73_16170 [Devosia sp.]